MLIIIGAGISGLTVARELERPYLVFEKHSIPGGLATQYEKNGYRFDFSGHYFHFKGKERIHRYLSSIIRLDKFQKRSRVFLMNRLIPYPLQHHIGYLPRGLAERIYRQIRQSRPATPESLQQQLGGVFGEDLYQLFFRPFLTKYYQEDPAGLPAQPHNWSIPVPTEEQLIMGYRKRRSEGIGYNPTFYYPSPSPLDLIRRLSDGCGNRLRLNETVTGIDTANRRVITDKASYPYSIIVNTMPLNELLRCLEPNPVESTVSWLRYVSTLVINVVVKKRQRRFHWLYLPQADFPFYRLGYYPRRTPPACYLECNFRPDSGPPEISRQQVADALEKTGIINEEADILHYHKQVIPVSYVVPHSDNDDNLPLVHKQLNTMDIFSIGRYGAWRYSSMSDDIALALDTVKHIKGEIHER